LSVSGYWDRIPAEAGEISERDIAVAGSYVARGYDLRGEWSRMHHETEDGSDYTTTGWYVLVSRSLSGRLESVRPYLMLDRLEVADGLSYFGSAQDQSSFTAGARWDVDPAVALKADVRSQRIGVREREVIARLQIAFALN